MKRIVAIVAAIGMVAIGVGTASASSDGRTGRTAISTIDWQKCAFRFLRRAGARCAMLSVPLDYSDPTGEQIQIALSRVRHTVPGDQYQGVMLVNPGGPGGSGLALSTLGRYVPKHAGDAYDWIGFDPRGVGSSVPALSCIPKYFHPDRPPYVPKRKALEDVWLARSERYADACEAAQPDLLPHMSTIDSARDMDSIRQALGVDQINYYGFSYGTYLGQVYNTLFPGRIRRAVFDGTVHPLDVWYQANLNQDIAFDRNIRIWFAWLAKYRKVYHLGRTEGAVSRTFYAEERALKRRPAGGIVGPAEWDDVFLIAGYAAFLWPYFGDVFAGWVHDQKAKKLIRAYLLVDTPGDDNLFAVYLAVECTDAPWPSDWQTWRDDNWATYEQAPFFTWGNAWFNAPCFYWSAPAGTPTTIVGGSTPLLLISETLDAATPYPGSVYVRSLFPDSALIAEPGGTTHAGSLNGNTCVDDRIAKFLKTGALPARQPGDGPDLECQPLPPPVPRQAGRTSLPEQQRVPVVPVLPGA